MAVELASALGWNILPSGNIYRAVALSIQKSGVDKDDEDAITQVAKEVNISFKIAASGLCSYLNDEPIDKLIIGSEISALASHLAKYPKLRQELLPLQREFAKSPGLVAEGRDMGTVVFPDAGLKLYLDASAATRAKRRYNQLCEAGDASISEKQVLEDIINRDHADSTRANAPLKQDSEAIVIETDDLTASEVVAKIISIIG